MSRAGDAETGLRFQFPTPLHAAIEDLASATGRLVLAHHELDSSVGLAPELIDGLLRLRHALWTYQEARDLNREQSEATGRPLLFLLDGAG
jgi:hypothetical protein